MADAPTSDSITGLIGGQLISQHYLTHQLPERDDWKSVGEDQRANEIEGLYVPDTPTATARRQSGCGGRPIANSKWQIQNWTAES
jgi:hypothetical protein